MDLKYKVDFEYISKNRDKIKKIFFYRICGTGMGSAACLLAQKGYEVEGGDTKFYPPMSDYLKTTGILCHQLDKLDQDYFKKFDLIVVGNVVPRNSDDARMIEKLGISFSSFPEVLGALVLSELTVVGIAGTHGKTTTTYLITQLFKKFGFDPGYFIGGILEGAPPVSLGDGKYFFIESDEYDSAYFEKISKFRHYCLDHMILTSIEFDHGDIFKDIEAIKDEFRAVIPKISNSLIVNSDYDGIVDLHNEFSKNSNLDLDWKFYGENSKAGPIILDEDSSGTSFQIVSQGKKYDFRTNLIGRHNILNLTSAIIFAIGAGISIGEISKAVLNLGLVKRRQEERGFYKGALVIDDFAHHPSAVSPTISAIRTKYPGKQILAIIEPCSATARSAIFQNEFTEALMGADALILAKAERPTTIAGVGELDCHKIASEFIKLDKPAQVAESLTQLRDSIEVLSTANSVILVLSNATCLGLWESDFVNELSS